MAGLFIVSTGEYGCKNNIFEIYSRIGENLIASIDGEEEKSHKFCAGLCVISESKGLHPFEYRGKLES